MFKNEADYDSIKQGESFKVKDLRNTVSQGNAIKMEIGGRQYEFTLLASERQREILLTGGLLNYTRSKVG